MSAKFRVSSFKYNKSNPQLAVVHLGWIISQSYLHLYSPYTTIYNTSENKKSCTLAMPGYVWQRICILTHYNIIYNAAQMYKQLKKWWNLFSYLFIHLVSVIILFLNGLGFLITSEYELWLVCLIIGSIHLY